MNQEQPGKKKKGLKRELIEWGLILSVIGFLYFTGLHVPVVGNLQRVFLWTGLMNPDTKSELVDSTAASYNLPLLTLDENETLSLRKYEGKTIFLNFWATWCPPCIAEMPNIQSLYEVLEDQNNVQFVMVSLDEDHEKAREYLKRKEYTMPVYFLNGSKPGVYSSTVVPTTYVISPEGKIVLERRGMANYHSEEFKEFLLNL